VPSVTAAGNDRHGASAGGDEVVGVVGLGYVGLPLAVSFAEAGFSVVGIEGNDARVQQVRAGRSPIGDVPDERLRRALGAGLEVEAPSAEGIARCDAVFVCVPTPIDEAKVPDLRPVLAAASTVRQGLRPGHLIVLQSTTYPGTTTGPFREELERGGLRASQDFDLAYAPERVSPGDAQTLGATIPRLVGGLSPQAGERAAKLLARIADQVVRVSSPDAAELAKLHENVFRNVNIALVNQLALLCERMGLDVWEVLDAAATKPFGFMRFSPGPGVGGHCIPVDPYYLAWRAREFDFVDRFVETAGDINLAMPRHVAALCATALNDRRRSVRGCRIGIVGVAFKPDVGDARNSPAAAIMALLAEQGAVLDYHDPYVSEFRDADGRPYASVPLDQLLRDSELVVILTAHAGIDWDAVFGTADLIVDTVNISKGHSVGERAVLRLGAGWGAESRLATAQPPSRREPEEPPRGVASRDRRSLVRSQVRGSSA
jgi:UDP-N-acetyl-D-glucosamine dehydrogenase